MHDMCVKVAGNRIKNSCQFINKRLFLVYFSLCFRFSFVCFCCYVKQEFTCPLCAGGFIEELPPNSSSSGRSHSTSSNDDVEMTNDFDNRLSDRISSLLMSSIGGGLRNMDEDSDQSSTQDGSSTGNENRNIHCNHQLC